MCLFDPQIVGILFALSRVDLHVPVQLDQL